MEDITVTGCGLPVTGEPDNLTEFRLIPEKGTKALHYGTNFGACLSYHKGKWKWVKLQKNIVSKGSKTDHGGSDRYLRYNCNSSPFHNRLWHSIIAMLFCDKELTPGKQVHHLNNNGYCCRADNLVVVTPKEHQQYHQDIKTGKVVITNLQKSLFYVTQ